MAQSHELVVESLAAFLAKELHDGGELAVVGAANYFAADFLLRNQSGPYKAAEMKGQGRWRRTETSLDVADDHSIEAGSDEQPVDVQPGQAAQLR